MEDNYCPIGVFDSGSGGLTILEEFYALLPQYDYLYLGDHARAPYGPRSFETIYQYTLEAVEWFFSQGCRLVILACNTASAKALRSIQQKDLAKLHSDGRVLGVIRPTTEIIGSLSPNGHVGIFATNGTVQSESYILELDHLWPNIQVSQQACPMWVPLIENNEHLGPGADYFVKKYLEELLSKDADIDTILLACTHYPLIKKKLQQYLPDHIHLIDQGKIVASSLKDYLKRHPEMEIHLSQNSGRSYFTTESTKNFDSKATIFISSPIHSQHLDLNRPKSLSV